MASAKRARSRLVPSASQAASSRPRRCGRVWPGPGLRRMGGIVAEGAAFEPGRTFVSEAETDEIPGASNGSRRSSPPSKRADGGWTRASRRTRSPRLLLCRRMTRAGSVDLFREARAAARETPVRAERILRARIKGTELGWRKDRSMLSEATVHGTDRCHVDRVTRVRHEPPRRITHCVRALPTARAGRPQRDEPRRLAVPMTTASAPRRASMEAARELAAKYLATDAPSLQRCITHADRAACEANR